MATITFRLDDRVRSELEQLAASRGVSLSDLVRTTVEQLVLPNEGHEWAGVAPVSLSPVDRQQLALLHRILAHVMPDDHADAPTENCAAVEGDPEYQRQRAQILEGGYVTEYGDVFISTMPELSADDCRFVLDVLDLFQQTAWAMSLLRDAGHDLDPDMVQALTFQGFDFNDPHEGRLFDYARHRVTPDRWAELLPCFDGSLGSGNSHAPMTAAYRRMVAERQKIIDSRPGYGLDRYRLNVDDLMRIAGARSGVHR